MQCTFHDEALQEHFPRSYVQSLNERIAELSSQVTLQESYAARSVYPDRHVFVKLNIFVEQTF